MVRAAKTDADRRIAYDPSARPEVSNLVLLAALCLERDPHELAEELGDGGAVALKQLLTEAVNERLRSVRRRRRELIHDRGYLREVLRTGTETARAAAIDTLDEVRQLMHTVY